MLNDSKSPIPLTTSVVGLSIAAFGLYAGSSIALLLVVIYLSIVAIIQLIDYMNPIGTLSHKTQLASIENNDG